MNIFRKQFVEQNTNQKSNVIFLFMNCYAGKEWHLKWQAETETFIVCLGYSFCYDSVWCWSIPALFINWKECQYSWKGRCYRWKDEKLHWSCFSFFRSCFHRPPSFASFASISPVVCFLARHQAHSSYFSQTTQICLACLCFKDNLSIYHSTLTVRVSFDVFEQNQNRLLQRRCIHRAEENLLDNWFSYTSRMVFSDLIKRWGKKNLLDGSYLPILMSIHEK